MLLVCSPRVYSMLSRSHLGSKKGRLACADCFSPSPLRSPCSPRQRTPILWRSPSTCTSKRLVDPIRSLHQSVLGEMPEVGSTVGMVALLEAGDQDSDPGTGHYYSPPCAIFGACPVGALTVGSSTSPVFAFGELFVYNDQNIFGTGLPQDAFYEALYGGTSTGSIFIDVGSFAPLLPTSTFTSDAIPPPTALQALQFQMFGSPNDYDFDEAGTNAFTLSGTARAVESQRPCQNPARWSWSRQA